MPVTFFWTTCPRCMALRKYVLVEITPEGVGIYKCSVCGQEVMR